MISSILKMHNHQYEQFDVESLDFIKLAFTNQRFRNLILGVDVKGFASTYDTQTEKVNTRNQVKTAGSPGESRPNLLV